MPILPLLLALATPDATPGPCAAALAAAPAARFCAAGGAGVALAETQARADAMLADAMRGEARFRTTFAAAPARYAVFVFDDPATIAATRAALRAMGIDLALPMRSTAFEAAQRARAAQAMAAAQAQGARVASRPPAVLGEPRDDRNHVPHELGHGWYAAAFWPEAPRPAGTAMRYGSAAPDWLDEAAAMLMEDDERTAQYRRQFGDGRDPEHAGGTPPEIPLATLVTMTHPVMANLPATRPTAGPFLVTGVASLFYAETRVFADYLMERSGDPRIVAVISRGLADGGTLDTWLARDGARHRLPASLAAMDADWQAWLTAKYGPAG